jgi:DNA-directed RNA polymerase alpha subunit
MGANIKMMPKNYNQKLERPYTVSLEEKFFSGDTKEIGKSFREEMERDSLNNLKVSNRVLNVLKRHNVTCISDLDARSEKEVSYWRNMGKESLAELKAELKRLGKSLRS